MESTKEANTPNNYSRGSESFQLDSLVESAIGEVLKLLIKS